MDLFTPTVNGWVAEDSDLRAIGFDLDHKHGDDFVLGGVLYVYDGRQYDGEGDITAWVYRSKNPINGRHPTVTIFND